MSKLEDNLKQLRGYAQGLEKAKRARVAVGLPKEKVGGEIYGDGMTIVQVGAIHEYGEGSAPQRSFLRVPFQLKADEINDFVAKQFAKVFDGQPVDKLLGLVGIKARNISVGAFTSQGYGTWPALDSSTVQAKGSSQPLIDTGTLRNSISYVVRGL
jgi:hypothetical protein